MPVGTARAHDIAMLAVRPSCRDCVLPCSQYLLRSPCEYARLHEPGAFGLRAGLWEFPAVKVAADAGKPESRRAINRLLEGPLGMPLAEEHVVSRQALGDVVHIFSHIRMTMRAEHIVLQVRTS